MASRTRASAAIAFALAVMAPSFAHGQGVEANVPGDVAVGNPEAQEHFDRGRALFLRHEWSAALDELRAAVARFESPNTRLYIARCLRETGALAAAYLEFERANAGSTDRALREPRYGATRDAARSEGAAVRARIAMLTLHVADPLPGLEVRVNGLAVPSASWDVATPLDPGDALVEARAPGRVPFHARVLLGAGQSSGLSIELPIAESRTVDAVETRTVTSAPRDEVRPRGTGLGPVRAAGIVVGAIGVAGAVTFAAFGALANGRFGTLRTRCAESACDDPDSRALIDEGERNQTFANTGLVFAAVGLTAGIIMIAVGRPSAPPVATAQTTHGLGVWAHASASDAMGGVHLAF